MSPSRWIERGGDGRLYYVRKRRRFMRTRELLAEILLPFGRRPDPIIVRQPPEPPRSESPQSNGVPPPPDTRPDPPVPSNSIPHPWHMYPPPLGAMNLNTYSVYHTQAQPQPPQHPPPAPPAPTVNPSAAPISSHDSQNMLKSALKQPQYYSQPHPSMWPTIPPGHESFVLPQGAQATSLGPGQPSAHQAPLALDAHKYKCTICGRYRSARYHYKHPLLPGHLPKKTICRKCRENATDSDDASTDSYEAKQDLRSRSRSRHRSPGVLVRRGRSRSKSRGRGKGPSKVTFQSDTSSDSSDTGRGNSGRRSRHVDSPATEIVRYVSYEPERRLPERVRTVYANPPSRKSVLTTYHEDEGNLQEDSYERLSPRPLRPSTPAIRVRDEAHRHPELRRSCKLRTEYFDGSVPEVGGRRAAWYRRHPQSGVVDDDIYRSRQTSRGGREAHTRASQRESSYPNEDQAWARNSGPPASRTPESSNRPARYQQQMDRLSKEDSPTCADNEVVVIESNEPTAVDDYDWYDEHGMRIRVREI